jgi:hypothetical protein
MLRDWPIDKTACPKSPPPVSEDVDEHLGNPSDERSNYALYPGGSARSLAAGQKLRQPNRPEM